MHSKTQNASITKIFFITLSLSSIGCGALGDREDFETLVRYAGDNTGCLNNFGQQATDFLEGKVSRDEWNQVFDCQIENIRLFKRFIAGTDNGNYTVEDIHALTTKILITNSDVSKTLIRSMFSLKASLFGGSHRVITPDELDRVSDLFRMIGIETGKMIPDLGIFWDNSNPEVVRRLADLVSEFGQELGAFFPLENRRNFSDSDLFTLVKEMKKVFNWEFKTDFVNVLMYAKSYLAGGSPFEIEGNLWNRFIDTASRGFSIFFLFYEMHSKDKFSSPESYENYLRDFGLKARHLLLRGIQRNGGAIQLSEVDQMIDALPDRYLELENDLDVDRDILKNSLRPIVKKLFMASGTDVIDAQAIETLYRLFDKWNRGKRHLDQIFIDANLDQNSVDKQDFRIAALQYGGNLDPQGVNDVVRLIKLSETYKPLFKVGTDQMGFNEDFKHSVHSLSVFHWVNLAVEHLMDVYAEYPSQRLGVENDFVEIFQDLGWLLFEFGVADPRVEGLAERRYGEANLFTHGSNGDEFFDEVEATYYVSALYSIKNMAGEILDLTQEPCKVGDERDEFGYYPMDTNCFRSYYYANLQTLWRHKPHLYSWYHSLDEAGKQEFRVVTEEASRDLGYSQLPVTSYDVDIWAGTIHYIEILFDRFDRNRSTRLGTNDILDAYPTFRQTIARVGELDPNDDGMIRAVFTYIVHYGEIPESNFLGTVEFIWWKLREPWWSIKAYRTDIYKIVTFFSSGS